MDAYQRGSLKKHEAIKQDILRNPSLVGIDKARILHIETEFPLIPRKRPIAQPDIVIDYDVGNGQQRVFIEVKSGSCKRALRSLFFQLRKVKRFLERRNIEGEVLGVYCTGEMTHLLTVSNSRGWCESRAGFSTSHFQSARVVPLPQPTQLANDAPTLYSRKILKAIEVSELLNETKQQTMEEKGPNALEMAA